jgi:hypothetical protein
MADAMKAKGYIISHGTIQKLLRNMGYTTNMKGHAAKESTDHLGRDGQCSYINRLAGVFFAEKEPVMYLDLTSFKLHGTETWDRRYGENLDCCGYSRIIADVGHESDLKEMGFGGDSIFWRSPVNSDPVSHAAENIDLWLRRIIPDSRLYVFSVKYRKMKKLYVICNSGDRNIIAQEAFNTTMENLAKEYQIAIYVSYLPPGTFRFKSVEHKTAFFHYFSHERRRAIQITSQANLIKDRAGAGAMPDADAKGQAALFDRPREDAWNRIFHIDTSNEAVRR